MRKERWRWSVILFLMLAGLFCPVKVHAEETDSYLDGLSDEMDYGKLDTFKKTMAWSWFLFPVWWKN